MNIFPRLGLALIAVGIAVAVGCAEGDRPQIGGFDAQRGRFSAPVESAAAPTANAAPAQVLRIAGSQPLTLDPARVRDSGSSQYAVEIFSGLVKLDPALNVVGDLATGWEVIGDGSVYRFAMRPSLKFADGRALDADDVRFSLTRALSPKTESETALTYLGDIEGARAFAEGSAFSLTGVRVVDPETVEIRLVHPQAFFLYQLTYLVSFVVDASETDEPGWYRSPNASGPFKLAAWKSGEEIVLEKNSNYHSPPMLSTVRIALVGGSEALLRYETGGIDIVQIGQGNVDRFRDSNDPLKADYVNVPQFSLFYLGFNTRAPPFDDVNVRRAFAKAIDVGKIVRVSLRGHQKLANGILPDGFPGHDPLRSALDHDPAGARAELAKSSYGSAEALPDITMLISGAGLLLPSHIEASIFLIRENLGVDVTVQSLEWPTFLEQVYGDMDDFQMYSLGWSADYPDPHNFLDLMFHSESMENVSRYLNSTVDTLLEAAREEIDPARRLRMYAQVESIVVNQAPIIPFWFSVDHLLANPNIRGLRMPPSTQEWMSSVWIAE